MSRYRVTESAEGEILRCEEAPGIEVRVSTGFGYSEADARKLGPRVILLDGAGLFPPLLDRDAQLYNLDHHVGCVRAFTLATCEQALVLVAKGLDLEGADWTVYANEPDLDTVLAIWILLNHRRVRSLSDAGRQVLLPLIRLEGAIDANGRDVAEFCGLQGFALKAARRRLDQLFARQQDLRSVEDLAPAARAAELLRDVDALVLTDAELASYQPIEEVYGHVELGHRLAAVACRDSAGIYAVEERLGAIWGARLGMVVLENRPGAYTLRASKSLSSVDLQRLYRLLNLVDPSVDGRPPTERWGGADDIGGSPRERGSALSPGQVLQAVQWAYRRPGRGIRTALLALATSLGIALVAGLATLVWQAFSAVELPRVPAAPSRLGVFGAFCAVTSLWLARRNVRRSLWVPGWRRPVARGWIALVPFALVGSLLGGTWMPPLPPSADAAALAAGYAGALVAAFGLEAWFRGWVQGLLLLEVRSRVASGGGLSGATLVSAAFYAVATVAAAGHLIEESPWNVLPDLGPLLPSAVGALLLGIALGIIRERSLSLWPGVVLQAVGAAGLLAARAFSLTP